MEPKWSQDPKKQRKELILDSMKALAKKLSKKSQEPGSESARKRPGAGLGAPNKENNRESGIV